MQVLLTAAWGFGPAPEMALRVLVIGGFGPTMVAKHSWGWKGLAAPTTRLMGVCGSVVFLVVEGTKRAINSRKVAGCRLPP